MFTVICPRPRSRALLLPPNTHEYETKTPRAARDIFEHHTFFFLVPSHCVDFLVGQTAPN